MVMAVLLLANFFVAPIPINQSVYEGVASVRGSVVDFLRHQTVAGAIVYAKSDADFQQTVSDQKGNFYFLQLLPGNYQFYASKVGYNTQCICCRQDDQELDAGFEYLSEVYLAAACYWERRRWRPHSVGRRSNQAPSELYGSAPSGSWASSS